MTEPDLSKLTKDQRRALRSYLRGGTVAQVARIVSLLVYVGFALFVAGQLATEMAASELMDNPLPETLTFLAVFACFAVSLISVERHTDTRKAKAFLADNETDGRLKVCVHCGYSLVGSVSDTCPECGAEVINVIYDDDAIDP